MWNFIKENGKTFEIVIGVLFALVTALLIYLAYKYERRNKSTATPMKKMAATSILAALSIILYYFIKIPIKLILPFMPEFFDLHFSSVPIYIGGFMFGPLTGVIIALLRMLVKLPYSSTLGVGELADLVIGVLTVLVSSFIYHKNKTKKGAFIALATSIIVWLIAAIIANWLFILPFYITLYSFETVYGMLSIIPGITPENYMLYYTLIGVIPFNLILSTLVSVVTFLIYKRVSIAYDSIAIEKEVSDNHEHKY
ncbi:MAG TPA: ECF transporter S component [Acholeplasma sp.]|nr:ECF transporter S component [Acholeplasma sp.]